MTVRGLERQPSPADLPVLEPAVNDFLDARLKTRRLPAYRLANVEDISNRLTVFLRRHAPAAVILGVKRLTGGGSKEQFAFELSGPKDLAGRYVLRMDAIEGVVASSRQREHEAMNALWPSIPVPRSVWVDPSGEFFPQPAMIMSFCTGVTKPTATAGEGNVVGQGTVMGARWRTTLGSQFVDQLAAIHNFNWRSKTLPHFQVPEADLRQAARWQVEWWSRVWREDKVASEPTMALARRWMLENLPECPRLAFVHGDYRTGNFLFDERSERITTILDWEMCHIGDPHEDLAWATQRSNGSVEDGCFYASSLMPIEVMLARYEKSSGRRVERKTLHFYDVFSVYKSICICLATAMKVSALEHSHQDVLLTWMSSCGHLLNSRLCELLDQDIRR